MDWKRLRRLAAEVDDEHREAMRAIHDDLGDAIFGTGEQGKASRRRFLQGLGLGGTVLTVGATGVALAARSAGAQTSTTTGGPTTTATGGPTTTAVPATTTTLPPKHPSQEDMVALAFTQSIELAVAKGYELAIPKLGAEMLPVATAFGGHHQQHGQAMAGLAGKLATNTANQSLLAEFEPLFADAPDEAATLKILFTMENAAASSYTAMLGQLTGTNGSQLVASILPIEARHAVVLGQAVDLGLDELSPSFEDPTKAVTIGQYPIIKR